MAANIQALALRAAQIKDTGNALTEADAIGKAIRGQGITHPGDVKRLMRLVGSEYARIKHVAARNSRRRL